VIYINNMGERLIVKPDATGKFWAGHTVDAEGKCHKIVALFWTGNKGIAQDSLAVYAKKQGWSEETERIAPYPYRKIEGVELDIAMADMRENETNRQWAARQAGRGRF